MIPILRNLPKLDVEREGYCSKKMTDEVISYLERNAREKLLDCLGDEDRDPRDVHHKSYSSIIEFVSKEASKEIDVPKNHIGMVDLAFEITKRLRFANNYKAPVVIGQPIAPAISGPYLEMVSLPIGSRTADIEKIDRVLDAFYLRQKELCFALSEGLRKNHRLYTLDTDVISEVKRFSSDETLLIHLYPELVARLGFICKIPVYIGLAKQRGCSAN